MYLKHIWPYLSLISEKFKASDSLMLRLRQDMQSHPESGTLVKLT